MKKNRRRKKRLKLPFYILVGLLVFLIYLKVNQKPLRQELNISKVDQDIQIDISDDVMSIAVVGDIMCHNSQYIEAKNGEGYDFSYVFEEIKEDINSADLAIGNLETTFAGENRGYSSYPNFNTPDQLARDLGKLGIDILSTANNHCLDTGYEGIKRTIEVLDNNKLLHAGTYSSKESSEQILFTNVNNFKIAFLAYTYGTNGIPIPKGKEYCVNLINDDKIISDLNKAKSQNPDLIIVNMHWGEEYKQNPNKEQERLAKLLFENGADLIFGSHPHVLERMEKSKSTNGEDKFVIYSLGNFISGQTKEYTKDTILLNLKIKKDGKNGKVSIENVSYKPLYFDRNPKYKLIDIDKKTNEYEKGNSSISKQYYDQLKQKSNRIKAICNINN